jgi:hypothetical protein
MLVLQKMKRNINNNVSIISVFKFYIMLFFVMGVVCDDNLDIRADRQNRLLQRHPRAADSKESNKYPFGTAASFGSAGEHMQLRLDDNTNFPNEEFSVQFWIKPEGGQYGFTPIIGRYVSCNVFQYLDLFHFVITENKLIANSMDPDQTARRCRLIWIHVVANPLCWFCRDGAHFERTSGSHASLILRFKSAHKHRLDSEFRWKKC